MNRLAALLCLVPLLASGADKPPVLVGLDAEFSLDNSLSAQAIETGLRTGDIYSEGERTRRRAGRT